MLIIVTPWLLSVSNLYRPSDRRFFGEVSANVCGEGCRVVSAAHPYGRNLGFLDQSRYISFQVAPQLYSRG
jgi:hypothetical protein